LIVLNRVARKLLPQARRNQALLDQIADYRAEFVAGNRKHVKDDSYPLRPERILAVVRDALPRDAIITTDVGWNKNGVGQQFPVYTPGSILTPGGFATMGFGAPAAIGAKLACPDRVVVALVGDVGQNPAVLATAVEQGIAVIWVVMNNGAYGTIAGLQMAHFGTTIGCIFKRDGQPYSPDFAAIARAYGADGVKIEAAAQFKDVLEQAIAAKRPFVIDVAMLNEPVPTAGHWNINDIYSPGGRDKHHVAVN
jgi:acetolactate synthase-1/2/3 large subunit